MKRLILQLTTYIVILIFLICIPVYIASKTVKERQFKNGETESNLLFLKEDEGYDIAFLGISQARNFSRHGNHNRVEEILNKKIVNLGQGGGTCGINEQLFYLDYFYSNKNEVKQIYYILPPLLMLSEEHPLATNTFDYESFDILFLTKYLVFDSENKYGRLHSYLKSKLTKKWINYYPRLPRANTNFVSEKDYLKAKKALLTNNYDDSKVNMRRFNKSIQIIKKTINLALSHNTNVVFIIPPNLLGLKRGLSLVSDFLKEMSNRDGVTFYDFSQSVMIPDYYYDLHHLNSEGVSYFTENYLKDINSD